MAAVNMTFQGMFYDKISRVYYENATMVGVAFLTDVGVGGGPIIPPDKPPPDLIPPWQIWGGRPGPWDGSWVPPQPPFIPPIPPGEEIPPPGSPSEPVPPPAGQGGWPVQPIVPPPFVVINYPGVGPIKVYPPVPPPVPA